jgi:hypothetical protein
MNTFRKFVIATLTLATLAVLPGCQVWNAWLDMLKWQMADEKKNSPETQVMVVPDKGGAGGTPAIAAVVPRVLVHRITAPVGTFSTNEKVWTELNEDALDSKTSVLMAQNGLRAGIGPVSRWPAIARLIEGPGVTSDQIMCQTDGRSSVNVVTRQGVIDEIVVSIDRDLQQQGRTFEKCDNGFKLSMRGVRGKPELLISLEPIVTLGTVQVMRSEPEVGITRGGFTSEEAFTDLQMAATLGPDHFLVVSSVDPRTNRFSVGSLWLSEMEKVPALETVLVFVPAANAPTK